MKYRKPLTKQDILRAMKMTKSNMAAARYLNVSYSHYKIFSKMYFNKEGKSLFEEHKNENGVGIPKHLGNSIKLPDLEKLLSGELWVEKYTIDEFKNQLIHEQVIAEECSKCGFNEQRVLDYKAPILLNFIDGNKKNWKKENLEFLCYNCYYLFAGEVFTQKEINTIEEHQIEEIISTDKLDMKNFENHFKNLEEDSDLDFTDYA